MGECSCVCVRIKRFCAQSNKRLNHSMSYNNNDSSLCWNESNIKKSK